MTILFINTEFLLFIEDSKHGNLINLRTTNVVFHFFNSISVGSAHACMKYTVTISIHFHVIISKDFKCLYYNAFEFMFALGLLSQCC